VLVAAAVCPHPPLLIPAAMGAAGRGDAGPDDAGPDRDVPGEAWPADVELRELRTCSIAAVAGLLAAGPDLLIVVGGAAQSAVYAGDVTGSLRPFGIPAAAGSAESGGPALPLSLTVGAWLLDQADEKRARDASQPASDRPPAEFRAVAADLPPADCLRLGAELAGLAPRVALLAMGDASARKAAGVHGAADPAAERYDAEVAAALAAADPGRLGALDPALDDELMVAGRAAWQVLAGAAAGIPLRGRLRCAVAPYDVSYLVASWDSAAPAP
jgi:hypothetical protein